MDEIDWRHRWRGIVEDRSTLAAGHADHGYWDRRAASYARSTQTRIDEFLQVLEPYLSPLKTLIDVGAGTGRHAVPLAERLEWVTAIEPSEGMRSHLPPRHNMTVIASTWEDAEVAPADLVICCHVLYGVADVVPFVEKIERSARERVFIMLREGPVPHPANVLRDRIAPSPLPPIPQFSDLFMLLLQLGIAADVTFVRYPAVNRYRSLDEAVADCKPLFGAGWEEPRTRRLLEEMLVRDGDELVYDGGVTVSGIAHWQPRTT